jgi:ribonuclease P protein component
MSVYLRGSRDFQTVYRLGKRYEAASVTAFVLPNDLSHHRLGVTASRKAVGNAVQRNRAKRVMREAFRLSDLSLSQLGRKYDWVLNAKSRLLSGTSTSLIGEFEIILESVARQESGEGGLQVA